MKGLSVFTWKCCFLYQIHASCFLQLVIGTVNISTAIVMWPFISQTSLVLLVYMTWVHRYFIHTPYSLYKALLATAFQHKLDFIAQGILLVERGIIVLHCLSITSWNTSTIVAWDESRATLAVPSVEGPRQIMSTCVFIQPFHQWGHKPPGTIIFTNLCSNHWILCCHWCHILIPTALIDTVVEVVDMKSCSGVVSRILWSIVDPLGQWVAVGNPPQKD